MTDKKDFKNGCLPANWVEVEVKAFEPKKIEEVKEDVVAKSTHRKDEATLLAELEEIKNAFEKIEEKKIRLQNLMMFYRGELTSSF